MLLLHLIFNAYWEPLDSELPPLDEEFEPAAAAQWIRRLNSRAPSSTGRQPCSFSPRRAEPFSGHADRRTSIGIPRRTSAAPSVTVWPNFQPSESHLTPTCPTG